jgi:hypothetical protein
MREHGQAGQGTQTEACRTEGGGSYLVARRAIWPLWPLNALGPRLTLWPWGAWVSFGSHSRGSGWPGRARHALARLEIHHGLVLGQQHLVVAVINRNLVSSLLCEHDGGQICVAMVETDSGNTRGRKGGRYVMHKHA